MELYKELDLEKKLQGILENAESHDSEHHFGKPFMTAYQIAILFNEKYPSDVEKIKKPFGGKYNGQNTSLVQYLAQVLSLLAKREHSIIEGAFLSRGNLQTLIYKKGTESIENSLGTTYDLSMYRLK